MTLYANPAVSPSKEMSPTDILAVSITNCMRRGYLPKRIWIDECGCNCPNCAHKGQVDAEFYDDAELRMGFDS